MNCKVCENTSAKNSSVSFFRFPKENTRCKDWAERCNLINLFEQHGTLRFYKSFRICSDHFDPKDIVFDGRKKRLLQSAAPQIFNPNKIKFEKGRHLKSFDHNEIFKLKLVENLCRLCAEENKDLTDIFGWRGRILQLEDKLKYFPVMMTRCDVLPLRVCHQCISKVNQFYDFIMNCMKAEAKLRIMLDLEECDTTYKMIKPENCKEETNWDSELKISHFKETPNINSKSKLNSYDVIPNSPETVINSYGEFHQVLQENISDLNHGFENADLDYFQPETNNCTETNQYFKTNDTNYIKEVGFSRNISFEHNYSNNVSREQQLLQQKIQTENEPNFNEETKFSCDICLESFTSVEILNSHSLSHSPQLSKGFEGYNLDESTSTCSKNFYQCQNCDKKFHKVAFLKKHSLVHQIENSSNYIMDLRKCDKSVGESGLEGFPNSRLSRESLDFSHMQRNSKPFKSHAAAKRRCQFCDRLFKNRQICQIHEESHGGKTPYQCKLCGKAFRSRQSLRQHRSVHSDKRLFTCQECGMSFKRKDTLRNHLRIHTGERPFVCKFCGFAFKQRGDCIKHEKNHDKTTGMEFNGDDQRARSQVSESTPTEAMTDVSQIRDAAFWNEEKTPSLPSYITIAEEITPVDTFEDLIAGPMISFNF